MGRRGMEKRKYLMHWTYSVKKTSLLPKQFFEVSEQMQVSQLYEQRSQWRMSYLHSLRRKLLSERVKETIQLTVSIHLAASQTSAGISKLTYWYETADSTYECYDRRSI